MGFVFNRAPAVPKGRNRRRKPLWWPWYNYYHNGSTTGIKKLRGPLDGACDSFRGAAAAAAERGES